MTSRPADSAPRRRVRLADVARAAGVSLSQASAAISGAAGVSSATRERVRQVAATLGYRPNEHALGLARSTRNRFVSIVTLGIDAGDAHPSHYLGALLNGILLRTVDSGLDVRMTPAGGASTTIAEHLAELPARDTADGYVLIPFADLSERDVEPLRRSGDPFVIVNRGLGGGGHLVATADFAGASRLAVDHVVALGHRRIGLVQPPNESSVVTEYVAGFNAALRAHGLDPAEAPRFHAQLADQPGIADLVAVLARPDAPTAVLCLNELVAHRLLSGLLAAGVMVPGDVSIVTFDTAVAPYTTPAMTSVDLHLDAVGGAAVDALAAHFAGNETDAETRIPATLIPRASTGPVRQAHQRPY